MSEALSTLDGNCNGFGCDAGLWLQFFVEFDHELQRAIFLQPGTGIAHYLQQPRAPIRPPKTAEEGARTK
jgi:hypothetical protein